MYTLPFRRAYHKIPTKSPESHGAFAHAQCFCRRIFLYVKHPSYPNPHSHFRMLYLLCGQYSLFQNQGQFLCTKQAYPPGWLMSVKHHLVSQEIIMGIQFSFNLKIWFPRLTRTSLITSLIAGSSHSTTSTIQAPEACRIYHQRRHGRSKQTTPHFLRCGPPSDSRQSSKSLCGFTLMAVRPARVVGSRSRGKPHGPDPPPPLRPRPLPQ